MITPSLESARLITTWDPLLILFPGGYGMVWYGMVWYGMAWLDSGSIMISPIFMEGDDLPGFVFNSGMDTCMPGS